MIKEIVSNSDIKSCLQVIRQSFKTVADEFNLTRKNAATNPAFLTLAKLKLSIQNGTKLFGLIIKERITGCIAIEK